MVLFSIAVTGHAGSPASFGSLVTVVGGDAAAVGLMQLLTSLPVLSKGVGFVPPASVVLVGDEVVL